MNKLIHTLFFLILFNNTGLSQNKSDIEYNYDVQLGFKISRVKSTLYGSEINFRRSYGDYLVERKGIEIGFSSKFWIHNFFYIRSEINYKQKGATITGDSGFQTTEVLPNYINIPILIGLSPTSSTENFKISVETGLGINILARKNDNLNEGLVPGTYKDYKNPIDFNIGINLEYQVERFYSFFFNYRYYRDLSYFFSRTTPGSNTYDVWIKGYSLSAGVLFNPKLISIK